jgi:hypothetical protein
VLAAGPNGGLTTERRPWQFQQAGGCVRTRGEGGAEGRVAKEWAKGGERWELEQR